MRLTWLFFVCLVVAVAFGDSYYYGPDTWYGRGSYTRADLVEPDTIYNSRRCNELVPETFVMQYLSGDYEYYGTYYSYYVYEYQLSIGQTSFPVVYYNAIPRFDDVIQLTNGVSVEVSVYILYDGEGSFLTHLFFDTSSFRSTDPSSPNFVEKNVCQVVYAQDQPYFYLDQNAKDARVFYEPRTERDDACAFLAEDNSYVTSEIAVACFQSVPFSSTVRDGIVDALQDVMAFYVYQDTNSDVSYGGDNIQLDIFAEIDRIGTTDYDGDYAMHSDILSVFTQMRDVHTIWAYPQCYRNWQIFQPFALSSYALQSATQVITISGTNFPEYFLDLYGITVDQYVGYIVQEIDGTDALTYLIDYADSTLGYKDKASRFNLALGVFTYHNSFRYGFSDSALTWKLKNPATGETIELSFDWLVIPPTNPVGLNAADFAEWCLTNDEDFACATSNKDAEIRFGQTADLTVASAGDYALYKVNSEVGVLSIPDFSSSFGYQHTLSSFTVLYLTSIHTYNCDRLIIDVSGNGGGYIYSGYFLSGLVNPAIVDTTLINNYDVIHNELMDFTMDYIYNSGNDTLREQIVSQPGSFFSRASKGQSESDSDGSWYLNGKRYTRGGKTSTYSNLFELLWYLDEDTDSQLQGIHNSVEYVSYPTQDIEILTDGQCFSTCSLFVHALIEAGGNHPPEIVGWGGLIGEPLSASEVPANVLTIGYLSSAFSRVSWIPGFPEELVPHKFPFVSYYDCLGSDFQIAYAESYNDNDNPKNTLPLEFQTNYVKCRLNVWEDLDELYSQAAYAFYYCPNSDFQSYATVETPASTQSSHASTTMLSVVLIIGTILLVA